MRKQKSWITYTFLFFYFFCCLTIIYTLFRGDTYVNFGFSYAIARGEIPYVDFNMVIGPFSPWIYSVFLLFSNSILCYYAGQALLLTGLFYFIFQLLEKKSWIYLVILSIPFPIAMVSILFPGYNFLLLFLFIVILYCEKKNKSDLVIGILLGISFMTKQTVGGLLLLPTCYYLFTNYRKVFKRLLGFFIPVGISCFLLMISGSFSSFIDLCFLGLLDFGHSNISIDYFYFIVFLFSLFVLLFKICKNPKRIEYYYVLVFASCVYPIIDYYHVSMFLAAFFFVILTDFVFTRTIAKHCLLFVISLGIIWEVVQVNYFKDVKVVHYPNFQFSLFSSRYVDVIKELDDFTENEDREVIYLLRGSENYFYKIKHNLDITYFDLPNYGNYGYQGVNKLIGRLKKVENCLVIIDKECYLESNPTQQYIKEAVRYIMKRGKLIKSIHNYEVYELE